ncbi:hypothetical protein NliqN6_6696 [Naganishia liquefaciens]|uniref:GPI mannosyltransferase 1 n=1 Tax=Naganishia liquefaciens TaxID=104408 RepID=A0A8H3YHV2_9TREE|nr:hypothetical protein NliqN6_6696 [Naganishia liquefaciens]
MQLIPPPIGPLFGKLLFSLVSAVPIPHLLLRLAGTRVPASSGPNWLVHALWTLNPLILNIATRGSSEALLVLLVLGSLVALRDGRLRTCAILWGAAVHWKLYPVIYASSILMELQRMDGGTFWTRRKVVFGLWSGGTVVGLSLVCWLIWGQPFIEHAFFYHATRLDHRHNFSAYFYPIYLQMFQPSVPGWLGLADSIARHPLAAFAPQVSLSLVAGFLLPSRTDIAFTWFIQTFVFVAFNKVCTSQYFIWYLFFSPVVIPRLRISLARGVLCLGIWIASQALWLAVAYRLEFQARSVFLPLWCASLLFLVTNCWCVGVLLDAYVVAPPPPRSKVE